MMFTMTKSVLLSALLASTSLVFADETPMIVGGDEANVGDYPYFVEMGGCGGALIAPDVVLFAAHCGNWKNTQVSIGAYRAGTKSEGAIERYCEDWIGDPKYNPGTTNYDFALCKLDVPVDIDESKVKLEINNDQSVPSTGEDLIVMGVGALAAGTGGPDVLHHVTVPKVSQTKCNKRNAYNGQITNMMFCAGFPNTGGKDSCQGDSGGPIVKRTLVNGKYVDTHVGVVSWGHGCALKNKPGVYARTSARFPWIKETMCGDRFKSTSKLCDNDPYTPPPPPPPCDQELKVEFNTDDFGRETRWILQEKNGPELFERGYMYNHHKNEHTLCLKDDQCYELIVTDSEADGMCWDGKCGNYKLMINGNRVVTGNGEFTDEIKHGFCTTGGGGGGGDDDDDDDDESYTHTIGTCNGNSAVQFQLHVKTDEFPQETTWRLYTKAGDMVFSGSNDLPASKKSILPSRKEYMCLKEEECYQLVAQDSYGDGITRGFFQGRIDNKKIFHETGKFKGEAYVDFCIEGGGGNCKDSTTFQFKDRPRQTCSVFATTKGKCKRPHGGGNKKVFDFCPESCAKFGLGCAA